ncbi:MAG: hypothetical protein ABIN25_09230 [Ginsengibacter sp.]
MIHSIITNTRKHVVVKLSAFYIGAFISPRHIIHEVHEFAHVIPGHFFMLRVGDKRFQ